MHDVKAAVRAVDSEGRTALHLAAFRSEKKEAVALLLEHGAAVGVIDCKGRTALHYAAARWKRGSRCPAP